MFVKVPFRDLLLEGRRSSHDGETSLRDHVFVDHILKFAGEVIQGAKALQEFVMFLFCQQSGHRGRQRSFGDGRMC